MNVWFRRALLAFAITTAAVLLVGLALGRRWEVEVRETIAAPPARIHAWIADLHRWPTWTTLQGNADAQAQHTFGGAASGVGATWGWQGPAVGRGWIEIVRAEPEAGVWIAEAIESDTINAHGSLTYEVTPAGTVVIWRDAGDLPPVVGGFFRGAIHKMLRDHFGRSLAQLKGLIESETAAQGAVPAASAATPSAH